MNAIRTTFSAARAVYEMARDDALEPVESDEECELISKAHIGAIEALLLTPAPDLAALAYKLETFEVEDCFGFSPQYRQPLFNSLKADVYRLGGQS